jgi:hypothetical protein
MMENTSGVKLPPNISRIIANPSMKNTGKCIALSKLLIDCASKIAIIKRLEHYVIQYSPNIVPDLM